MKDLYEATLLLVDDEPELLSMLESLLRQAGFVRISTAATAAAALRCAQENAPHAVLLDVMLPDMDGFCLFEQLRRFTSAPVLFLSARDEDAARLRGLGLGADDYITKPFLPQELTLRLCAVLRRTYSLHANVDRQIHLGSVTADMGSGVVAGNGAEKALTAKEYALLEVLHESRGSIVTIDRLCRAVWQGENFGYENTLMVHMRRLREKIETDPSHPRYLITVRGLGYKLLREEDTL